MRVIQFSFGLLCARRHHPSTPLLGGTREDNSEEGGVKLLTGGRGRVGRRILPSSRPSGRPIVILIVILIVPRGTADLTLKDED